MPSYLIIITIFIIWLSITSLKKFSSATSETIVLAHVIFRHGDRTPSKSGLWKTNKFYNESFYEPFGYAQLTNKGKRTSYNLGVTLKNRYDGFLNQWTTKLADTFSTDYDRTKMSASLVLGGLFPPTKSVLWNSSILWQPIPYRYVPVEQDKELSSWACPMTVPLIYADEANIKKLHSYDGLIKILQKNTGDYTIDYISTLDLYFGMVIQEEMGFPLDNWTKIVYPEPLRSYIVDFYKIETSTRALKTVMIGYLIRKILNDSINKINGTLNPQDRKIFLYSGHEVNVATIITSLELISLVDIPTYASYVIFELHKISGVHGFKIFYENYKNNEPNLLTLPGCKQFCPIEDFIRLTADIIPTGDVECFGNETENV
ncbi:unnamed protein product [Ceutorhynchus assimilis]|uniref:acid phosphatase n=1 Tax=Ceutorhynchus assimilis TaxID=467358 RepID=A0A9N9QP96_9CUCU|nr:unnamed protein product [Ceutorhynchus assimilis]